MKDFKSDRGTGRLGVWVAGAAVLACGAGLWFWIASSRIPSVAADDPLIGGWEIEGRINVFNADGTGRNSDGSAFRWGTRGGKLFSRAITPDGAGGDIVVFPYTLSRDRKAYKIALEGGRRQVTFTKVGADGRRTEGRSADDAVFDDPLTEAPASLGPGPRDRSSSRQRPTARTGSGPSGIIGPTAAGGVAPSLRAAHRDATLSAPRRARTSSRARRGAFLRGDGREIPLRLRARPIGMGLLEDFRGIG